MAKDRDRTKSNKLNRSKGWIGTRLTVCGARIHFDGDFVCLLPPAHEPIGVHATVALNQDTLSPILLVEDTDSGTIKWLE